MNIIGKGFHSIVYQLDNDKNNCIKEINLNQEDVKNVVEMDILNRLVHPNLLHGESFWFNEETNKLCYKTKFYKMNIIDFIGKNPLYEIRIKIMSQLISAINFLHNNDFFHGDIRLSNILIDNDRPILIDFGLSKTINQEKIINGKKENFKRTDIFMLACIFVFILTGKKLLCPAEHNDLQEAINNFLINYENILNQYNLNKLFYDLILNMMIGDYYVQDIINIFNNFSNFELVNGYTKNIIINENNIISRDEIYLVVKDFVTRCIKENYPTFILYHSIDLFYTILGFITTIEYTLDSIMLICFRLSIKLLSSGTVMYVNNHDCARKIERYCLCMLGGILLKNNYFTISQSLLHLIYSLDYLLDYESYVKITPEIFIKNQNEKMLLGNTKYCNCIQLYLNYFDIKSK